MKVPTDIQQGEPITIHHLSIMERRLLEILDQQGKSAWAIAQALGRNHATIIPVLERLARIRSIGTCFTAVRLKKRQEEPRI